MTGEREQAERFAELFRAVYLTFHRRDGPRSQLPGASRAVLEHLALAGPLTVGEAAAHMSRAQSVISEIVAHLERQGLLEREDDPADRRRTLIWLTPSGHEALRRDREVLGVDHLPAPWPGCRPARPASSSPGCGPWSTWPPRRHQNDLERIDMTTAQNCESCGMPIETGRYCGYCTDETGALQSFDERFERMVGWQARRQPDAPRHEIERQTLDYMATMPAWRDHPRVAARRPSPEL